MNTNHSGVPRSQASTKFSANATQGLSSLNLEEETINFDRNPYFDHTSNPTTDTYDHKTALSFYELKTNSNEGDAEFSAAFSPEALTKENASSRYSNGGGGVWNGLPQLWQDLACIPFQEHRIVGFRMGINTCLSVSDLDFGLLKRAAKSLEADTGLDERLGMGSELETADKAFWIKSTTRRPAPGTEWEFESQVACVSRWKEGEDFAWGRREGDPEKSQGGGDQRNLVGRKKMAVERLKGVLAHLVA